MKLTDFLKQFIERYLFEDLTTMAAAEPAGDDGHLGYPMLMSLAAGIEVLGILVSGTFRAENPSQNFVRYWENYLYSASPRKDVGMAVYQLVRNGIAHNFAAKPPFKITKGKPADKPEHLVNVHGGTTIIDAGTLLQDFRESYELRFRPVATGATLSGICGETAATMQARLDDLIVCNQNKMTLHSGPLAHLPASTTVIVAAGAGASGSLGPGPSGPPVAVPAVPGALGPVAAPSASSSSLKP